MAPFDLAPSLGHGGVNALYVATGIAFGAALERAGFGDSRNLAAQFYLKDMRVMKVMFTAIVTAMLLILWSSAVGWLDDRALYINPTYLGSGILGGFVFGLGFVIGGYCPGTALVSLSTLKLDGLFFVLGLGIGMFAFGETIESYRGFWDTAGFRGEVTLGDVFRIGSGTVAFGVVAMALFMFWGAERIEALIASRQPGGNR